MRKADRLDFPGRKAQNVGATTAVTFASPTKALVAVTAGVLTCRFADDGADVTMQVAAGGYYPVSIISVPVGNAVAFLAIF